jgi:hypothetical protein
MAEAESKAGREDYTFVHSLKRVLAVTLMFVDEGKFLIEMIAAAKGPIAAKDHFIIMHTPRRKCVFRNARNVSSNRSHPPP